jgi:phosphomannomutase
MQLGQEGQSGKEDYPGHSGRRIDTLEGVKVYDEKGWVLVLPDSEKPLCRVIGEGASEEFCRGTHHNFVRKVPGNKSG